MTKFISQNKIHEHHLKHLWYPGLACYLNVWIFSQSWKLIRIDRLKACLDSAVDLTIIIHLNSQLKYVKLCFPLYQQLRSFMAYGYVRTKNSQN